MGTSLPGKVSTHRVAVRRVGAVLILTGVLLWGLLFLAGWGPVFTYINQPRAEDEMMTQMDEGPGPTPDMSWEDVRSLPREEQIRIGLEWMRRRYGNPQWVWGKFEIFAGLALVGLGAFLVRRSTGSKGAPHNA